MIKKTIIAGSVFTAIILGSASAQPADCDLVQNVGRGANDFILEQINSQVAGTRERISRRKTLILREAESVSFNGCAMTLDIRATLKRRVRRNAHGRIRMRASVSRFTNREICLSNVRVADIRFSRTARIGERFYRRAANRAVPNNQCFRYR